ncbi:unnamed protein product [Amoebophrya sp. A25]|nr:unnamed protein product [Amoebophrya sp. A25]|eukprot:GSA25T00011228001.1
MTKIHEKPHCQSKNDLSLERNRLHSNSMIFIGHRHHDPYSNHYFACGFDLFTLSLFRTA